MHETGRIDLATTAPFRIGALCVEPALRQVSTADTEVETLEPRVMLVLVALARTRGTIVSRDQLIEQCWDSRIVGDDSINRVISRLRKLATAHGVDALFSIETISKVGYRLVALHGAQATDVTGSLQIDTLAVTPPAPQILAPTVTRPLHKRPLVIAGVAAALLIAIVTGVSLWPANAANDGVPELAITTSAGPGTPPGAALALHDEMARVYGPESLRIVDASQRAGLLTARIGNLDGQQVVFGELRPPGGGPAIWAPRYALRDAASIKGVAGELMSGARCTLDEDITRPPVSQSPRAIAAWAAYCEENDKDNPSHMRQIELLRLTTSAEPRFFDAQIRLGMELSSEINGRSGSEADVLRAEGRRAADAAERLDPRDAGVHMARSYLADERDYIGRDAEVLRALASTSTRGSGEIQLQANILGSEGRLNASLAVHQQMLAIHPGNNIDTLECARLLSWIGRYAEARAIFAEEARVRNDRTVIEFVWLRGAIMAQDWDTARRLVKQARFDEPTRIATAKLVEGLATGNAARLQEAGDLFEALPPNPNRFASMNVFGLGLTGRPVLAVAAAGKGFDANGFKAVAILFSPALAAARQTPEFAALVTRIGLADYWRKSGNLPDFCLSPGAPALCATLRRRT